MKDYCCDLFPRWIVNGPDEYIGKENDGTYAVTIDHWGKNHKINYCPFCGTSLPQNTNNKTYDGRVIDGS